MLWRALAGPWHGMCQVMRGWVEGRQARLFERERRATLRTVPQTVPLGTTIIDRRADGSILEVRVPALPRVAYPADVSRADVYEGGPDAGTAGVLLP